MNRHFEEARNGLASEQGLVVIAGDDIGREVIPLAVECLRAVLPDVETIDAEAGLGEARRSGTMLSGMTLSTIRTVGSVLMGPERPAPEGLLSATRQLTTALDLFANLYPLYDAQQERSLLLLMGNQPPESDSSAASTEDDFSPLEAWSATRLGNVAAELASQREGRVTVAYLTEAPFVTAVSAGIGEEAIVEPWQAESLLERFTPQGREFDVIVASPRTGAMLLQALTRRLGSIEATGRLLLGPETTIATPAHGPLPEQVGWGFANPLGAICALTALVRYGWRDEESASRLEAAIQAASIGRRTPDLGGLHTMYEVTRAILRAL